MEREHIKEGASRRTFLRSAGVVGAGVYLGGLAKPSAASVAGTSLALDGGPRAVTLDAAPATKWPLYGPAEIEAVTALLRNPGYAPIAEFEQAWKAFHDCPYVKAHCNGTSALTSMLFALDLPAGSEVLVPDYSTWFPVVPMRFFDLVPVFVDVNPRTMNICVEDCRKRLTPNTRAVMPVHWYGVPCDMDDICDFADEHGLAVVEDASHAHGARVKGKYAGNWGRMAGFSLQMGKPLPTIEGGMGMYKDRGDFERAVTYGQYELPGTFPNDSPYRKYHGTAFGSKLRMHPVSAILGRIQLDRLAQNNAEGVAQMKRLNDRLPFRRKPSPIDGAEREAHAARSFLFPAKRSLLLAQGRHDEELKPVGRSNVRLEVGGGVPPASLPARRSAGRASTHQLSTLNPGRA